MSESWKNIYDKIKTNPSHLGDSEVGFNAFYELSEPDHIKIDSEKAWNCLLEKIPESNIERANSWVWKVAASVLIILAASISVYLIGFSNDAAETYLSESTQHKNRLISLPDGTKVTLASFSSIQYPEEDFEMSRVIHFKGEAFFEVQKSEVPFTIKSNDLAIKVLGTSFNLNVKTTPSLFVKEGRVNFQTKDHSRDVTSGQYIEVNAEGGILSKIADPNVLSWRTGEFKFNNTKAQEVFKQLSKHYGVEFSSNDQIKACRITVNFEQESLENVVTILSDILNAKSQITKEKVLFSGKGC